jgi:hypothetical protein
MQALRVDGLPAGALEASAMFHAECLGGARELLATGSDLAIVFQPADHTHRAWRLAIVQGLAREFAPSRVVAVASVDPAAIYFALHYLKSAEGLTGQYLALDGAGAGDVIPSPQ